MLLKIPYNTGKNIVSQKDHGNFSLILKNSVEICIVDNAS